MATILQWAGALLLICVVLWLATWLGNLLIVAVTAFGAACGYPMRRLNGLQTLALLGPLARLALNAWTLGLVASIVVQIAHWGHLEAIASITGGLFLLALLLAFMTGLGLPAVGHAGGEQRTTE